MYDVPRAIDNKSTRFMDQLRIFIRSRNLAYKTEKTYTHWIVRFIRFHQMRHPSLMLHKEVEEFLSSLVVKHHVSINTQKTALNALVFLYREFLQKPIEGLEIVNSHRNRRLPAVFSHNEASAVINNLSDPHKLIVQLMYGGGLRISEAIRLRIKDIDFSLQTTCEPKPQASDAQIISLIITKRPIRG